MGPGEKSGDSTVGVGRAVSATAPSGDVMIADMSDAVPPLPPASAEASRCTVFFISDGTGITAETFGNSIRQQFAIKPRHVRRPFIDSTDKAHQVVREINHTAQVENRRPDRLRHPRQSGDPGGRQGALDRPGDGHVQHLHRAARGRVRHHLEPPDRRFSDVSDQPGIHRPDRGDQLRLAHDDGQSTKSLAEADVILVGVSRSGKTPTSLYLAMQHGIKAANYPLIPEDFERGRIPASLASFKAKCFGLTIDPERLARIRNERRPNSKYASIENCRWEVQEGEGDDEAEGIAWLSSTHKSIEEIATTILRDLRPDRLTVLDRRRPDAMEPIPSDGAADAAFEQPSGTSSRAWPP
jgi:regulator of PEP synthase PpsR (kinase-PPPase family)